MNETITKDELPTSFGSFNPIGHMMVGLPDLAKAQALTEALRASGLPGEDLVNFTPRESVAKFEAMTENASDAEAFGYELRMQLRYLEHARRGWYFLLVKVQDGEGASRAAEIARSHGATLAVYYRMLVLQEMI